MAEILKNEPQTDNFSQSDLNIILRDAPLAIYEFDLSNLKFKWINKFASDLLGYSETELSALKITDLLHEKSIQVFQKNIAMALSSQQTYFCSEVQVKTKNGSTLWGLFNSKVILVEGKPSSVLVFAQNITESKKIEEAIKENEQLYHTLFENTDDGFILFELVSNQIGEEFNVRFLKVNNAYERQTGRKADDLVGKTTNELASKLEPEWMSVGEKVVKSGKPEHIVSVNKFTKKWYDAHFIPFSKGQVGILFRDITERKQAEKALRESKNKYQALIETTSDFIWEIDVNGRYTYCSPQMEKLWGINPSHMIGKTPFDLMPAHAKERAYSAFLTIANDPKPFVLELPSFDGQKNLICLEIRGVPFFSQQGRLLGFRGISRDMTERKNFEKQLQDNARMATIGQTAGMVGHDIRNPLQAITGEIFLLNGNLAELPNSSQKSEMAESLDSIAANVSYINKIVSDLQDYARPLNPEISIFDLSKLIHDTTRTIIKPDNINLSVKTEIQHAIRSDQTYIRRSITNLVNNAIQAMPDGGSLEVECFAREDAVFITVSDTGVGIPEHIKAKLFTPMVTTKSKGQGLGLAVVKRLIEALNGTITFESQEGKGTKFMIELTHH